MRTSTRRGVFWLAAILSVLPVLADAGERQKQRLRPPVISPAGGHYGLNEPVQVSIRAQADCTIIYTLDGRFPSEGLGTRVEGNLALFPLPPGDVTILAIAVRPGLPRSSTTKAVFTRSGK